MDVETSGDPGMVIEPILAARAVRLDGRSIVDPGP
jgi:hypothetical protein